MLDSGRRQDALTFGVLVYWLFAALFIPTAAMVGVQASVPMMMGLLVFMARKVGGGFNETARCGAPVTRGCCRAT